LNPGEEHRCSSPLYSCWFQFSPDGEYTGPVTCVACHAVNENGVPVQLMGTDYYDDYWASVVLMHLMRGEDYDMPVVDLIAKYPYEDAAAIVAGLLFVLADPDSNVRWGIMPAGSLVPFLDIAQLAPSEESANK